MTSASHGHFVICFLPPIGTHEVREREREREKSNTLTTWAAIAQAMMASDGGDDDDDDDDHGVAFRLILSICSSVSYLRLNWRVTSARTVLQFSQAKNLHSKDNCNVLHPTSLGSTCFFYVQSLCFCIHYYRQAWLSSITHFIERVEDTWAESERNTQMHSS